MVRLALILLAAPLAWAQLAVYTLDSAGRETAAEGVVDIGKTFAGDTLEQRVRLRNLGAASMQLTTLRISGPAYSLDGHPTVPHLIAPGSNVDFRVRFQPQAFGVYSATLQANDRTAVFRATAEQGITVLLETNGALAVVDRATPVDFGRVERGQALPRRFYFRNDGTAAVAVGRVDVTGSAFAGETIAALPLRFEPGASRAYEIRFAPTRSGILEGSLSLDDRVYRLQGVALEPPLPEARIVFTGTAGAVSGEQRQLQVRFTEPSRTTATATLSLAFEPAAGLGDDPGVQFLRGSARSAALSIVEGEAAARWNGSSDVIFQTGTTAGVLVFRLQAGARNYEERISIAPAAPKIDSAKAARVNGGIEVTITGFDNTRSASSAAFTFFDKAGRAIGDAVRVAVGPEFAKHFRESSLGGVFLMRAQFPVSGDALQITGVEVELTNSAGAGKSERVAF
ncbi:MAG: choice-of-anchor D domain-containing protein [Bryobacteraceae bacterium]